MKQAVTGMVDFLANKFGADKVRVGVGHGQAIDFAKMILEQAVSRLNVVEEPVLFDVGPVIGVHTGPGTVGISVHSVTY
jgi:fatty acid-binding protein DegV